jgi:vacuolar-type H+-ATPase subunit E/Vma4
MTDLMEPTVGRSTLDEQLGPVRQALLDDANAEAERIRAEARERADSRAAEAEREVAAEVAQVAERQAIASAAHAEQERARARADAHATMLGVREEIRRDLLEAVRTAAMQLRDDDRYPALLDRLEAMARGQLGSEACLERDPAGSGGVVAVAGARRVDYTLPALAERALREHGDEVASLWA